MDLERCKVLISVIENGNLTTTAQQYGFTPSGISRIISNLENEFGFPLLYRKRDGVVPTQDCLEILPNIEEFVKQGDQCLAKAASIIGISEGMVRIATAHRALYGWIRTIISDFMKEYPNVEVDLVSLNSTDIAQKLEKKELDIGLISQRKGHFLFLPLGKHCMDAWVSKDSEYASLKAFPIELFNENTHIDVVEESDTDTTLMLRKYNIHPPKSLKTESLYEVNVLVGLNYGISIQSSRLRNVWNGNVVAIPVVPADYVVSGLGYGKNLSPSANAFVQFFLDHQEEYTYPDLLNKEE